MESRATLWALHAGTFFVVGAARPPAYAVWDVPAKFEGKQVAVQLDSTNTMAAPRANDSN